MSTSQDLATLNIEQCKHEIRETSRKESAEKLFLETYEALQTTLRDTYPECKDLQPPDSNISSTWCSQFQAHGDKVYAKDPSIMLVNIPALIQLQIPQLWVQDKFTANSKHHMWLYLTNLLNFANSANSDVSAVRREETKDKKDIDPPSNLMHTNMMNMYDQIPKNVLDKVKHVADKYVQKMDSGDVNIDGMDFAEVSKDLFSQINPQEMQQMVATVGNMLKGVMSEQNGGMADMLQAFSDSQKE
jgi:hypothetical protein